jgi:hypothetical protein
MSLRQPQFGGAAVHQRHKGLFTTRHVNGDGHGGIVCRRQQQTVKQVFERQVFARAQIHRAAAYGQRGRLTRLHPELPNFPDTISLVYRADLPRTVATGRLKHALVAHGRALDRLGDAYDPHEHPLATTLTPLPTERIDTRPLGTTSSRTPTTRRPRSKK